MNRSAKLLAIAGLIGGAAAPAGAQLTLSEALRLADNKAYPNRIAAGNANAQSAQAIAPMKGILPSLRFEGGYVRTTDPIGVFGTILRQRSVSQANFDPQRLNYPDAIGNYQTGVVLEQPLFNADAWAGRRAALDAASAVTSQQEWTRLSTRVDVVRAYYGAILAAEQLNTLRVAARAAHAHVSQAESMVRQGLVTKSDALLASVRAGEVDVQLAEASAAASSAKRQLDVALGGTARDVQLTLPDALPSAQGIVSYAAGDTAALPAGDRADVDAASHALKAARADYQRARSVYLPRLNSFARYDWNSEKTIFGGDRSWTIGVMVAWNPFTGASEIADVRTKAANARVARAQSEAASAQAQLDLEQSRSNLSVALERVAIAERSAAQSAEAHRIVSRKYEGGIATVVELLDAQAAETQSALAFSNARYAAVVAAAERLRALGNDPGNLAQLDSMKSSASSETSQPKR